MTTENGKAAVSVRIPLFGEVSGVVTLKDLADGKTSPPSPETTPVTVKPIPGKTPKTNGATPTSQPAGGATSQPAAG